MEKEGCHSKNDLEYPHDSSRTSDQAMTVLSTTP